MNIERKISFSILFAIWLMATTIVFTAYNILHYTLTTTEKLSALQDLQNVELMLYTKYMEELLNQPYFIQEKNAFNAIATTLASRYSPKEKHSPTIESLLANAKAKGIYIDVFSREGDKVLSLTGRNDITTIANLALFTGHSTTIPPINKYSFLRINPHALVARSFLLAPLTKHNSFLLISKQHSLLDKKILTKQNFTHIRRKILTSFSSSQYTLSFVNKESVSSLTEMPLRIAIQNAKKDISTSIQYNTSSAILYATKYVPVLQGYLVIQNTLSALLLTLNNVLVTLLYTTFILLLLYTALIPLIIKFFFIPLKKSLEQFRIFSENFSTFSRIDIMAMQSALPLIHKKGNLGAISLFFSKMLHALNNRVDSFIDPANNSSQENSTITQSIQKSFIPNLTPFKGNSNFTILVNTLSASKISHTFYDATLLNPKTFYFTLGELSQKNLSSILWASTALKILKGIMKHTYNPLESIKALHTILQDTSTQPVANSLLTGFINLETGLVRYASIGNSKIIHIESLFSQTDFISQTPNTSTKNKPSFFDNTIQLQKGDRIYLYNYTTHPEKLHNLLLEHKNTFSKELFQMIISTEITHKNINSQYNDIISMCIQFKEKQNGTFAPIPTTIIGKDHQDNIVRSEGIY